MKLIIDIPKEVVVAIENDFGYRYDIHTAIAQGTPYEERECYITGAQWDEFMEEHRRHS